MRLLLHALPSSKYMATMLMMVMKNGTMHMMMMRGRRMEKQIRIMVMMTTMAREVLGKPRRL